MRAILLPIKTMMREKCFLTKCCLIYAPIGTFGGVKIRRLVGRKDGSHTSFSASVAKVPPSPAPKISPLLPMIWRSRKDAFLHRASSFLGALQAALRLFQCPQALQNDRHLFPQWPLSDRF